MTDPSLDILCDEDGKDLVGPSSFINNLRFESEHEVGELILSDLPLAEQSILLFWFFQFLLLKFCLEQFQHMLFCLQHSCFANRLGLTRFFKKLFHNVSGIAHRIVGPSASTGVTHRSDLLKLY